MNPVITRIAAGGIAIVGGTVFALSQLQDPPAPRAQTFTAPQDAEDATLRDAVPALPAPGAQSDDSPGPAARPAARPARPDAAAAAQPAMPVLPADPDVSLGLPQPRQPQVAGMGQTDLGQANGGPDVSAFGLPCGLTVRAEAQPGALIALDIEAPCRPDTRVEIAHADLTIADRTDALGLLSVALPAFETPAAIAVRLPGSAPEAALVAVPDLADYDRVGVSWMGRAALELHALEFGAAYGGEGHVSHDNPRGADRAVRGAGGFLTRLGRADMADPMMAEVYTFPRDTLAGDGVVRLSLEAPITQASCGARADARTLQAGPQGIATVELAFDLPGCEAVGDALVLQNLLPDLRIAAN